MNQTKKLCVLFVCIGNACRSPMAEAILRQNAGDQIEVSSAGLFPLGFVPEMTLETLKRNGYSTEGLRSKPIERNLLSKMDLVLNLSGYDNNDVALRGAARIEEWPVADPFGEDEAVYQKTLEEIQGRVRDLLARLQKEQF